MSRPVAGLLTGSNPTGVFFDNPSSIDFMWAVCRLHRDSERDWNRRPLVGRAARPGRRPPRAEANS
jgi:hypothetical protein